MTGICRDKDSPVEREENDMRHKVTINVTDENGRRETVLKGADRWLPRRLLRLLLGDFTQVYLLKPGQSIESVDVNEIRKEKTNEDCSG